MVTAKEQASVVRWTARVLGVAVVAGFALLFLAPRNGHRNLVVYDINNVKQITAELILGEKMHATPDGRIDAFRTFFESVELDDDHAQYMRNERAGRGPSLAEIRAGDYRNFAWERARVADVRSGGGETPVIWDPRPIDGERIVGFKSGLVRVLTEEEFAALAR